MAVYTPSAFYDKQLVEYMNILGKKESTGKITGEQFERFYHKLMQWKTQFVKLENSR